MMLRAQTCFLLPSVSCLFYGCFSLYLVLKCVGFLEFYLWPTLHVFLSSHGSHSQRSVSPGKISLPSFEFCIFNCFISSGCLSLFTGLWSPQRWVSCLICYQDLFCRKQFIYSPIECMHKEMDSIHVCWMNNKLRWKEKKKTFKKSSHWHCRLYLLAQNRMCRRIAQGMPHPIRQNKCARNWHGQTHLTNTRF